MEHIEITYESHERLQLDNTKEATDGTDVFCLSRASSDRLQKLYKIRPRTPTSKNGVSPRQNAKIHSLIGTNMQDRSSTNSKTAATWCPPTEKASANQEQHRRGQAQKSIRRSRRPTPWPREGRRAQSKTRPVALRANAWTQRHTQHVCLTPPSRQGQDSPEGKKAPSTGSLTCAPMDTGQACASTHISCARH